MPFIVFLHGFRDVVLSLQQTEEWKASIKQKNRQLWAQKTEYSHSKRL